MKRFSKFLALGLLTATVPLAHASTITIDFSGYNPYPVGNTQPLSAWYSGTTVQNEVLNSNYTQSGYLVSQVSGTDYLNANQGDAPPGLSPASGSTDVFEVSDGGSGFLLNSLS